MRRIGVFLDDFDPFRVDHLDLAAAAGQRCGLEKVFFVPLPQADKKEKNQAHAGLNKRYQMCSVGLADVPDMEVIPYSLVYQSESPIPLIRKIRRTFIDAKCFFILSASTLIRLAVHRQFQSVQDSTFLYYRTPDFGRDEVLDALTEDGLDAEKLPAEDIRPVSGRDCRRQIALLQDPERVDPRVTAYICRENIYLPDRRRQLQKTLNAHRWQHSLGVQSTAILLALHYRGAIVKVSQAALYHDCAKCLSLKEMQKLAEAHHLKESEEVLSSGALLHGPAGALYAQEAFGISDSEVLDAIRYHTTGRENMTLTDLIIFVADAIEPNREDYEGLAEIRRLSRLSLKAAALESLYATRRYVLSKGKPFYWKSMKTIAWLESTLTEEEKKWMQMDANQ